MLLEGATQEDRGLQQNCPKMGAEIGHANGYQTSQTDMAIVDSGASGWYFTLEAPVSNVNKNAATIHVSAATGQAQTSKASCELPLPDLQLGLFGHIMSGFTHNLFGIGNICDKDCTVLFKKDSVIIYDSDN